MTVTEGGRQGDEGGQKYGAERRQEEGAGEKKKKEGMMERLRGRKGKTERGSE